MRKKEEIISFKVDESLAARLGRVPNRSDFIRRAVLLALDSICPLCQGSGVLSADQREHWQSFAQSHTVRECDRCHSYYLVCESQGEHGGSGA